MNEVFVVYYDAHYMGLGERGAGQRRIDGVFDSAEAARARIRELESMTHVAYADFESFVVEE
jgi:hypothetical protein